MLEFLNTLMAGLRKLLLAATICNLCLTAGHANDNPVLVADTPVTHSLLAMVAGEMHEPVLLLDSALSPHHFTLKPSHARLLQRASHVFMTGEELMPQLARHARSLGQQTVVTSLLQLSPNLREYDEHNTDPHAWLDPHNAIAWLQAMADVLATSYPHNSQLYADNAARASHTLELLTEHSRERLQAVASLSFIAQHDAYGYFADAFDLQIAGTIAAGDEHAPGAARLRQVRALVQNSDCLWSEPGEMAKFVDVVSKGVSISRVILDPVGITLQPGKSLYPELLSTLVDEIVRCAN